MATKYFMIASALFLIILQGCGESLIRQGNEEIADKSLFHRNAKEPFITQSDFIEYFGTPDNIFSKDGCEVFEYIYAEVKAAYFFNFVYLNLPLFSDMNNHIWGPFFLGEIKKPKKYKTDHLFCFFDSDGYLIKTESIKTSGKFPPKKPKL